MLPENYADYINKCANYYYNYVDVGDYSSVTYSIRKKMLQIQTKVIMRENKMLYTKL